MAKILFLDTSGADSVIALLDNGSVLAERENNNPKDHAAFLNVGVQQLFQETRLDFKALDAVAVMAGPGSYTGLRVSVAAAKGYCYALNIPLLAINKLEILARQALSAAPVRPVLAALPARSGEWYAALLNTDGDFDQEPKHGTDADLIEWIEPFHGDISWTGSSIIDPFTELDIVYNDPDSKPNIQFVGEFVMRLWKESRFENIAGFSPYYLKSVYLTNAKG
jgi:tRNA threonylcarbamoyladenosine biosynthesis protein TsaB